MTQAWNDLTPPIDPVFVCGRQSVFVAHVKGATGRGRPHVMLRLDEGADSLVMHLTPSEARRVALSLIHAADRLEDI